MAPFHQMLIIVASGLLGFLVIVGVVTMLKPSSPPVSASLPADVIDRSQQYVARWGSRPFDELNTKQKLLLIHSYYNLGDDKTVIHHAETMIDDLRQLPWERKLAFVEIIENAYRRLGQENIVEEFRKAVDVIEP
jgi:hypothetical protein